MELTVTITETQVATTYWGQDIFTLGLGYMSSMADRGIAFTAVFA